MRVQKNLNYSRIIRLNLNNNNNHDLEPNIAESESNLSVSNTNTECQINPYLPQIVPVSDDFESSRNINVDFVQDSSLINKPNEMNHLVSSYVFRHNLSKKSTKDLFELLKLYKKYGDPEANFNSGIIFSNMAEYSFCDFFHEVDAPNKTCVVCRTKPKHFLTINDFLVQACDILFNCLNIKSNTFHSQYSLYSDGISLF